MPDKLCDVLPPEKLKNTIGRPVVSYRKVLVFIDLLLNEQCPNAIRNSLSAKDMIVEIIFIASIQVLVGDA